MFKGKKTAVFDYFVGPSQTQFTVSWADVMDHVTESVKAPIRGLVYADPETGVISRLTIQAMGLPASFRIKESRTVIDYDAVNIGGRSYTLPVKASVFVQSDPQKNLNEITFTNYRKFEAESVLSFSGSKITYGSSSEK